MACSNAFQHGYRKTMSLNRKRNRRNFYLE
jgi:hypothetical protein